VPVRKWLFSPISLLAGKNYGHLFPFGKKFKHLFPFGKKLYRSIKYMPAVIFFARLDLEKNRGIYLPSVKNYLISGQTLTI
jgi:hypothetical protein